MQSWKVTQQKFRKEVWLKRVKSFVLAVVLVALLMRGLVFVEWLQKTPKHEESSFSLAETEYSLNQKNQINFVVNPDWVFGYDRDRGKLTYFRMGEYESFGQLSLMLKQIQVPIDAYLFIPNGIESPEQLATDMFKPFFQEELETNLSRFQAMQLLWNLRSPFEVETTAAEQLPEESVIVEGLKVSVMNGTDVSGLALETASWIENIGAKVIDIGNAVETTGNSVIEVFLPEEEWVTVKRLEQIFGVRAVFIPTEKALRGDIRVIVGSDYLR